MVGLQSDEGYRHVEQIVFIVLIDEEIEDFINWINLNHIYLVNYLIEEGSLIY